MTTMIQGDQLATIRLGRHVAKAAVAITGISTKSLFTVSGGRVLVLALYGEVTVGLQAQANAAKFISTPTTGTAVDLCTATETNGKEIGALLGITGLDSDALDVNNAGHVPGMERGVIVPIGTIGFNTAASSTGSIKFDLWYVPLDTGATVEAA